MNIIERLNKLRAEFKQEHGQDADTLTLSKGEFLELWDELAMVPHLITKRHPMHVLGMEVVVDRYYE